jgi:hypothetical protein
MPWHFEYQREPALPALAWLAAVGGESGGGTVRVRCGMSVRCEPTGFIEGTWVGVGGLAALPRSTTIFGSGIVADGDDAVIVPPSHPHERLYLYRATENGPWLASNSLAWLLLAAGVELRRDVDYPPIFIAASEYVRPATAEIPTTDGPVIAAVYENFRIGANGRLTIERRPTERPFARFADYAARLSAALASAVANAPAGYEMVVALSSGYDSTAVAVVAAALGCRRAVTFGSGTVRPDSGTATAERLGMSCDIFDRLAYQRATDLVEADFLATGMSGEDAVIAPMAGAVGHRMLLTGSEEFLLKGSRFRPELHRGDLSWCSVTEFRLRTDFLHVPLLFFGATEQPSLTSIIGSPEMDPWRLPGKYDKPIQRRLAEEAGLPRGSFATRKRRASGTLHSDGLRAMAPTSVAAVAAFAQALGEPVPPPRRIPPRLIVRWPLRLAKQLRLKPFARLERRRRSWIHFEPRLGSLLLRWAISVVQARYGERL